MDTIAAEANPRFELAVLGCAIANPDAWEAVTRSLTREAFTVPSHARLFDEIARAEEEGYFGDTGLIAQALVDGGTPAGYEIVGDAITDPAPENTLGHYVDDLRKRANVRQAARLSQEFAANARARDPNELAALLEQYQINLAALSDDVIERPWESVGELLRRVELGETKLAATFPTGFYDLDGILQGGFRPGQMVTIAGRPSMGKSTLAVDFARHASFRRDVPGLLVSLEMSASEIGSRIAAAEAAIPLEDVINGNLSDDDRAKVAAIREDFEDCPLDVLDIEDGWGAISAAITAAHRRNQIKFAIIDYLQLVTLEDKTRNMSRQDEIAQIARRIKLLAKRLQITIVAVAQLNREAERRSGNVPQLSDLRESGAIEQDSDVVGLVHRPDYYDETQRPGEADIHIAKQRNGPKGCAVLRFQGAYARFVSPANEDGSHTRSAPSYPEP